VTDDAMTEAQFQQRIVETARLSGWLVWYQPDWIYRLIMRDMSRRRVRRDWPEPGFPDLWMVHPERKIMLVLECKAAKGSLRPPQRAWLDALRESGIDARMIKPRDLENIELFLMKP